MRVDVDRLIDDRPISALQIRVFVLCALVTLLDAIDSQSIGVAGPLIAKALNISPAYFWPAYSAGLFGATVGAFAFGPVSDRYGRRPTLVFTTFLFGIFTCLTVFADSFPLLIVCRLIAGLGLGGATPCFITLAAEYAPERHRATLVSLLWAAYPLGNAVGGFQTSYLIKNFHWSMVFYAGGVPTLVVAVMLWALMPESLRFHVSLGRSRDAARGARALDPSLPENIEILAKERPAAKKFPIRELFTEGRAAGTILLGLMLYFGFWTTTVIVLQTPTLFREAGIPLSTSAWLVGTYSLVATIGMAIAGLMVKRFGALLAIGPTFVGGALLLAALGIVASSPLEAGAVMMCLGLTVSLASSGVIALTATSYPTAMRSAGTGWVLAMGRFGQVCSPAAVSAMLGLGATPRQIYATMALAPLLGGVCVLLKPMLSRGRQVALNGASLKAEKPA